MKLTNKLKDTFNVENKKMTRCMMLIKVFMSSYIAQLNYYTEISFQRNI